ncbi:MAG: ElyC/SanA/YdcF family protein [Thermodesulfobacteriota bacterium]
MIHVGRSLLPLIEPLFLALALLLSGLALLALKRKRAGVLSLGAGTAILLVSGYAWFAKPVLRALERAHPPLIVERLAPDLRDRIRHVVILGSGHVSDPDLPRTAQISASSLYRLVEGIRLYRQLPGSKLVIAGGVIPDPVTNARVVGDVAQQIGVPAQDAIIEERPSDTLEEARLMQPLLGRTPFVLVTSAAHMARAVRIFEQFGMHPVPAPTDYIIKNRPGGAVASWLPNSGNLWISQRVIYEGLGKVWAWIRN